MRKLWVFGDSYSSCTGISRKIQGKYTESDQWFDGKYDNYRWTDHLASMFGWKLMDFSQGGSSNVDILVNYVRYINEISKDDTVIMGLTHSARFRAYSPLLKHFRSVTQHGLLHGDIREDKSLHGLKEFFANNAMPYQGAYDNDWLKTYLSIPNAVILHHNLPKHVETWKQWSKGDIDDLHPSMNGIQDIAKIVHYAMIKKERLVHRDMKWELINEFKVLPYVEYDPSEVNDGWKKYFHGTS